jgi:dolichol-phosphate mannosyltransferase
MDCDLQEPPEEIPRLFARAQEGFDVVYARRKNTRSSLPYRAARWMWYRAFYTFTRTRVEADYGTLSLMSRRVADAYLQLRDRSREHILILSWLGFDSTWVEFEEHERFAGKSSYTLGTLLRFSFDRLFFQTTVLLRWIVYLGFAVAAAGITVAVYFVATKIFGTASPGWTSLAVFTLTIGGFVIISTGVTGLYIGKVFEQVKGRPLFVVDRTSAEELDQARGRHELER